MKTTKRQAVTETIAVSRSIVAKSVAITAPRPSRPRHTESASTLAPARVRPPALDEVPAGESKPLEIDHLIAPSIRTVRVVYQALRVSVERVDQDSRAVLDALRLMGDTLELARGSATMGGGLGLLGPMALPIPLAIRAMMAPVSKYVQQRTGISLDGWMDFAGSTQKQFEEYLAQIEQVATIATTDTPAPEAKFETAAALAALAENECAPLRADEALLRETKAKTGVWRPVLAQFAQFGHAMDALLDGWRAEGARLGSAAGKPEPDGWAENIGSLFHGAAAKVTDHLTGAWPPRSWCRASRRS